VLATIAIREHDLAVAARLLGATGAVVHRTGISLETIERRLFDEVERALLQADDQPLAAARAEARGWAHDEAVQYALRRKQVPDR
jgi:hypothetical protein